MPKIFKACKLQEFCRRDPPELQSCLLSSQLRQKFLTSWLRIVTVIKLTQQEENQSMYLINPKNQNKLGSRRAMTKKNSAFHFYAFFKKFRSIWSEKKQEKKASIRFAVREQVQF
jgi:hypothetical protein